MSKTHFPFYISGCWLFLPKEIYWSEPKSLCFYHILLWHWKKLPHPEFVRPQGVPAGVGRSNGRIKSQSGYQTELTKDIAGQMSERGKFIGNVSLEGRDVNCASICNDYLWQQWPCHGLTSSDQWPIRGQHCCSVTNQKQASECHHTRNSSRKHLKAIVRVNIVITKPCLSLIRISVRPKWLPLSSDYTALTPYTRGMPTWVKVTFQF